MSDVVKSFYNLTRTSMDRPLIFQHAADVLKTTIGFELFTILGFETSRRMVSRLYSSDPESFPVGGFKALGSTEWGRKVLIDGQILIAKNKADLTRIFPDHDLLINMGLGSAANIPIKSGGRIWGMLNMLHKEAFYTTEAVIKSQQVADLLGPVISAEQPLEFHQCARE
jgi:hypothetical protein